MDFLTRTWENPQAALWDRFDQVDELIEKARARLGASDEAGATDFVAQAQHRLEQILEQDGPELYEAVCEKIGQHHGIPPKDIPRLTPDWLSSS